MSARTRRHFLVWRVALGVLLAFVVIPRVYAQDDQPSADQPSHVHSDKHDAQPSAKTGASDDYESMHHAAPPDANAGNPVHHALSEATTDHIPPPPPQNPMQEMNAREMIDVMGMDDDATFAMLKMDRLEYFDSDPSSGASWNGSAWIGGDFDKLLVRSEGESTHGNLENADAEFLWDHAVAAFWDMELGVRQDFGQGPHRTWAAFGVQGLAPYWFEIGATAYVGNAGRTALRFEADYELSLTQRLILQPRFELNAYGKDDPAANIGSGISDAEFGLRLRYEIRREFAPYVGVERVQRFGRTADFARANDISAGETQWVVGLRLWY
jgi:copper resistance protein B